MLVISFWSKVTSLVLTALFEGPTHDAITQGAYSVGQPLALPHIIETMEISFFCAQRSCTLTHMGRVITNEVPLAVRSGDSVQIRVAAPEAAQGDVDPTEHLHF